ncbi:small multi-drug export protein [uncultured Dysosmobacter sp.]|uniref:COG2426 family protein n=1 Tax=uncultured Dysosmobacter sp. TaxID=2591384 RepID=UPI00262670A8|nr:small multi-drug export protein [uncultured Dysosmobacter sp.]
MQWLTAILSKVLATFFLSMVPVIELRGGLPYGIAQGLNYPMALFAAMLGNLLPVPFVIAYIRRVFAWLRGHNPRLDSVIAALERKAHLKGRVFQKYGALGLCLLVAIPLPGTGAWTGALAAAMLDIRISRAFPAIFCGLCIAAAIMTAITFGVIQFT